MLREEATRGRGHQALCSSSHLTYEYCPHVILTYCSIHRCWHSERRVTYVCRRQHTLRQHSWQSESQLCIAGIRQHSIAGILKDPLRGSSVTRIINERNGLISVIMHPLDAYWARTSTSLNYRRWPNLAYQGHYNRALVLERTWRTTSRRRITNSIVTCRIFIKDSVQWFE